MPLILLFITYLFSPNIIADDCRQTSYPIIHTINYQNIFGEQYNQAEVFLKINENTFDKYGNRPDELKAIIFPELVRYNMFKDFFETEALKLGYVEYGPLEVDFSVGRFQIKPSFIESIEDYVSKSSTLKEKYYNVLLSPNTSIKEKRKMRVNRLESIAWQIRYLSCFYDIISEKFKHITWKNKEEKIAFYATAYNHGINNTYQNISEWIGTKTFPYGTKYQGKQYSYSDISVNYFTNQITKSK